MPLPEGGGVPAQRAGAAGGGVGGWMGAVAGAACRGCRLPLLLLSAAAAMLPSAHCCKGANTLSLTLAGAGLTAVAALTAG